jgi:hypothetical protein
MTKKIITGVIAAVLVVTIAVFAAEKVKEKAFAEKSCPKARTGELQEQHEGLLDQLAEAYKANDRQKMGEIINKMQERREEMQEHAKFNRWHKEAHRRMMGQAGPGCGQGQQMAGPGFNQGCAMNGPCGNCGCPMQGQGWNQGCPMAGPRWGQFQAMNGCGQRPCGGMGNCGPMAGGCGQMPCQQPGMGMGNCMPQQNGPGQTPGWERGGSRENCGPEQNGGDMEQRGWNMPRHERQNVPPTEWGW